MSIFEIYDERIFDLLSPETKKIELLESALDQDHPVRIKGLSSVKITTVDDFTNLFKASMMLRRTRETKANSNSSRSHLCV